MKSIVSSTFSSASASATESPAGPMTVADSACDSGRPSSVQIAPLALQSPVSGSRIVTAPRPLGSMWIVHSRLVPCCRRLALYTVPPLTVKAWSRSVV